MAYWREKDGLKYLYGTVDGKKDQCIKPLGDISGKEADAEVDSYHAKYGRGNRQVGGSRRLMVGVFDDYLKYLVDEDYSPKTIRCVNDCVKPFVDFVPQVRDLSDKLKEWNDRLKAWTYKRGPKGQPIPLSTESRAHKLRAISAFCAWMVDQKITDESPFETAGVQIPAQREDAGRALRGQDVKAIFANWPKGRNPEKQHYSGLAKLFFHIVFFGGTRTSEVLGYDDEHQGAQFENVDREKCILKLDKTKAGVDREVALPKPVIDMIPQGTGPIFYGSISYRTLTHYYKRACKLAGIKGRVRIHDGRVSAATEWARKNRDPRSAMDQFGWKTARMAMHYQKVATEERVQQAQNITYE